MKPVDNKCPCCGVGLSLNWHKGKPVDYCPDHGGTDENGEWVYADGFDETTTNEPQPE